MCVVDFIRIKKGRVSLAGGRKKNGVFACIYVCVGLFVNEAKKFEPMQILEKKSEDRKRR